MNFRSVIIPLLLAVSVSGCITFKTRSDGITRLRIGETGSVDGPVVTPLRVISDSRCPIGVQCVWAGEVRIAISVRTAAGEVTREIVSGRPEPIADGALELVEVTPGRKADEVIYPDQYRFGFTFAGGL